MKKRRMTLIVLFTIVLLSGVFTYWYTFLKPHKNILKAKPEVVISASELISAFQNDETGANTKFLGKVIQINGTVVSVDVSGPPVSVVLEDSFFGVSCYIDSVFSSDHPDLIKSLKEGQTITIKGQCDGMLADVVISRAVIVGP